MFNKCFFFVVVVAAGFGFAFFNISFYNSFALKLGKDENRILFDCF